MPRKKRQGYQWRLKMHPSVGSLSLLRTHRSREHIYTTSRATQPLARRPYFEWTAKHSMTNSQIAEESTIQVHRIRVVACIPTPFSQDQVLPNLNNPIIQRFATPARWDTDIDRSMLLDQPISS